MSEKLVRHSNRCTTHLLALALAVFGALGSCLYFVANREYRAKQELLAITLTAQHAALNSASTTTWPTGTQLRSGHHSRIWQSASGWQESNLSSQALLQPAATFAPTGSLPIEFGEYLERLEWQNGKPSQVDQNAVFAAGSGVLVLTQAPAVAGRSSYWLSYVPLTIWRLPVVLMSGMILLSALVAVFYLNRFYALTGARLTTDLERVRTKLMKMAEENWQQDELLPIHPGLVPLDSAVSGVGEKVTVIIASLHEQIEHRTKDLQINIQKYVQANKDLEQTNATKNKFFSIIAHDLKSPFNALKGYTGIINDSYSSLSEEQRAAMIAKIAIASEEAHGLLENLLQWALIQSNSIRVKWEVFSIQELVAEVFDLMAINAQVKKVKMENRVPANVWIEADRNMVSTIFRNLVANSIKFSKEKGAWVRADAEVLGDRVAIHVKDNGLGMSESEVEQILSRKSHFSKLGSQDEQGTGLGIGLCGEFINMNRGEMTVRSKLHLGSTFELTFLRGHALNLRAKDEQAALRILCVDDSEDNHNLIQIYLQELPWQIDSAFNGREALDLVGEREYHIILMDLNMPVMGGIEATMNIRKSESHDGSPPAHVIAFTSSVLQQDIDAAISAGCDSYLVKPVKKQKLINTIRRIAGIEARAAG